MWHPCSGVLVGLPCDPCKPHAADDVPDRFSRASMIGMQGGRAQMKCTSQASLNLHHLHQQLFDWHVSPDTSPELVSPADMNVSLVDVLLKIIGR